MSIKEEEKIIFDNLRKENSKIVEDGVVDEEQYLVSKYKIIYIMKEVNGGSGWNLKDFLFEGARSQTWDNIARWTEGIFNLEEDFSWKYLTGNNEDRRKVFLKKIGIINLKKTSGKDVSISKEISSAAVQNREFIKVQIKLYDPKIIICCGTGYDFIKVYFETSSVNWSMTKRGVQYIRHNNKIIVSFAHPAARVSAAYLYYALIDAINEIIG